MGVLPLAEVKSRLFGHTLAALPFCVYGGVAAEGDRARQALDEAAHALAHRAGCRPPGIPQSCAPPSGLGAQGSLRHLPQGDLAADEERNLNAIPRKQRAMVRKGIKAGPEGRDRRGRRTLLHRLRGERAPARHPGVPEDATSRSSRKSSAPTARSVTITQDGRAGRQRAELLLSRRSAALLRRRHGVRARSRRQRLHVLGPDAGAPPSAACRIFDFGRSKLGTGAFDFKKNWGFEPHPLHYEYLLVEADDVPDNNPLNPKYQLFIKLWKRMPLPLANLIGPHIVKNLG